MPKITIDFKDEEYFEFRRDLKLGLCAQDAFSRLYEIEQEIRSYFKYRGTSNGQEKNLFGQKFDCEEGALQIIRDRINEGPLMENYYDN